MVRNRGWKKKKQLEWERMMVKIMVVVAGMGDHNGYEIRQTKPWISVNLGGYTSE